MDSMPMATILASRATAELATSARPDAPVVADRATRRSERGVRAPRTRSALAGALHRAADAVAPPRVTGAGPHVTAH